MLSLAVVEAEEAVDLALESLNLGFKHNKLLRLIEVVSSFKTPRHQHSFQ